MKFRHSVKRANVLVTAMETAQLLEIVDLITAH